MQDDLSLFDTSLADLPKGEWCQKTSKIAEDHGHFQALGKHHFATFVEDKPIILVTFAMVQGLRSFYDASDPIGRDLFKSQGWSHLSIISDGHTWFRDPQVYAYLTSYCYRSGSYGYVAAAFSVAMPGVTFIAVQPQATSDPRVTEWDNRFIKMRRTDFTIRYCYAPDMLDAADQAYVICDPYVAMDVAHAATFTRSNVKKLWIPNMGSNLQSEMKKMDVLLPLFLTAADNNLTTPS